MPLNPDIGDKDYEDFKREFADGSSRNGRATRPT